MVVGFTVKIILAVANGRPFGSAKQETSYNSGKRAFYIAKSPTHIMHFLSFSIFIVYQSLSVLYNAKQRETEFHRLSHYIPTK